MKRLKMGNTFLVFFHTVWNSNIDKTVKKFFRSSLQSCWVLQFSLFPRREGVMHMLSTLQTSYLIAGLCVSWVAKSMLSWAVSALLISISWQKWQHEKSIEMISDRLMDGFIFCKRSSEQTRGDFCFSTEIFSWYASRSGLF